MHVEIPRVATYFSEQNKICLLGIFSYMGYFLDGILSSGILSSGILSSWDFVLRDFFLVGFFPTWDFVLMGFYPDTLPHHTMRDSFKIISQLQNRKKHHTKPKFRSVINITFKNPTYDAFSIKASTIPLFLHFYSRFVFRWLFRDLPPLLENMLVGYADDSILFASVSSLCERPTIAGSLNRDLVSIDKCCARWGMLINSAKTYGKMISRSRTALSMFPELFVGGSIVKMVEELKIFDVVLDFKPTFESHVRSVAASAYRRIGILRKTRSVFRDNSIESYCFLVVYSFCSWVLLSSLDTCCR